MRSWRKHFVFFICLLDRERFKEQADHSFLLACTMRTVCEEVPDFFDATLEADYIFLCDKSVKEGDEAIEQQGVPVVQKQTMALLKTVLGDMGYEKFLKE